MRPAENIERLISKSNIETSADFDKRVLDDALSELSKVQPAETSKAGLNIWSTIMKNRIAKFASIAAVLIVILGATAFLSFPKQGHSVNGQWWLGSSAAWGQEILGALDKVKGVTCRERTIMILSDGSTDESSTWNMFYMSEDSYRRDIYDGDQLREIQWYVPDDDGKTIQTGFRHDTKSYFTTAAGEGSFGNDDPVERFRFYVRLLDKADRRLDVENIMGSECVGFEISASKYGNNPEEWFDRIWFDIETKLPVCIEKHGHHFTGRPDLKYYRIMDQFNYNPELAGDTFVPWYPEGYIYTHPDDIRSE